MHKNKKGSYAFFSHDATKYATTHERMLREVLEENTRFDDKRIK